MPRSLGSKRCLAIKMRVSDTQCHSGAPISPSHAHQGLRRWGSSERRPAGTSSASRWRSRQLLFLCPGSGSGAGVGKVGPWWGRGKMALRGWAQRGWGCGQAWAPPVGGGCPELSAAQAPRLLGRRYALLLQQKCGFRKAPRKVEPRRSDPGSSGEAYKRSALIPPLKETVFYPSPYPIRTLVKPFFFTVGFTGCAFGSAAIWQYESLKSRVQSYFDGIKADWLDSIRPQKEGDLRKEINKWWNSLSDGQRTVTGLC